MTEAEPRPSSALGRIEDGPAQGGYIFISLLYVQDRVLTYFIYSPRSSDPFYTVSY